MASYPTRRPATPPPLPGRRAVPPPLPNRGGGSGISDPYATPAQLDRDRGGFSTRDVLRAHGSIYDTWIATTSQNVNRMKYVPDRDADGNNVSPPTGSIWIEFLDLSMYEYPHRPLGDWMDLFESSSKGRFAYYEIRGPGPSSPGKSIWPFIKHRDGTRSSSEVARERKKRAPVGARQAKRTYTRHGKRGGFGKGGVAIG